MKPHRLLSDGYLQISLAAILLAAACLNVYGQTWTQYDQGTPPQHAAGVSPVGSYVSADLGTVNLGNGALNLSLPMGTVGGRGFGIPLTLNYSSKVWSVAHDEAYDARRRKYFNMAYASYGAEESYIDIYNRIATGWTIGGVPILKVQRSGLQPCESGYYLYGLTKLTVVLPDKGEIELRDDQSDGAPLYLGCSPTAAEYRGQRWHATDGSGAIFVSDIDNGIIIGNAAGTLITADGMRYRFQNGNYGGALGRCSSITDRNGNQISINHFVDPNNINHIETDYTDQLGRLVKVEENAPDPANQSVILPLLVTLKGYQGTPQYYKVKTDLLSSHIRSDFNYNGQQILTGFNDPFGGCYVGQPPGANYVFPTSHCMYQERIDDKTQVSQVILPDGRSLQFSYNLYGELAEVVLPTGAKMQYDYNGFTSGFPAGNTLPMEYQGQGNSVHIDRAVTERRTYPDGGTLKGTFTYAFGPQTVNGTSYACSEAKIYEGSATTGTLLSDQRHFFLPTSRYLTGAAGSVSGTGYSLWSTGVEWRTEVLDANGNVISASEQDWAQRTAVSWTSGYAQQQLANDNRVSEARRYLDDGSFAKTDTFYDNINYPRANNVSEVKEYDFDQSFKRLTRNTYKTGSYQTDESIHLVSLVEQQSIYTDSGGTNEAARTVSVYDVYADDSNNYWMEDRGVVVGHDNSYGTGKVTRGNLTSTGRWLKGNNTTIFSYLRYDTLGNPVSNKDANGKITTLSYSDDFGDGSIPGGGSIGNYGNSYALPTLITSPPPTPGAPVHTARTQYDFWSGLLTGFKDRNGVITQTIYNDPFSRPTLVKSALGTAVEAHAVMYYAPATAFGITLDNGDVLTAKDQTTLNDATLRSWTHTDGFGRTIETWSRDPQGDDKVSTVYDAMGRVRQQSNPFRPSLGESAIFATTIYDLAGRVSSVTTPDSATVNSYYRANQVLVKDQMSKERMSQTNALGQLTDVWEITATDDSTESISFLNHSEVTAGYRTKYAYDTLGNLTTVTQQKGTTGSTQTRTFLYNSLSQLTDATNPESGHIGYDYDANGNLLHKTDARTITTTYAYDALNRNTTVNYSNTTIGNPDVPDITRVYDGATNGKGRLWESYAGGNATVGSDVEHTKVTGYDALGRPLSQLQEFKTNSVWSSPYPMQRAYNIAGEPTSQGYPSGHEVAYAYDTAGRANSFTGSLGDNTLRNYATEILYSPLGGMTKEKFGTDPVLYNKLFYNSRGQLAEIREGTSYTGPNDTGWERGAIINYYSTCWGMCGGHNSTTAMTDNNGNLKKQEIFVPGSNSWLQQYDYDNLNRLQRVHEYTGNQSLDWQQEYVYDRYGNRRIEQDVLKTYGSGINKKDFTANVNNDNRLGVPAGQTGTMSYDTAGNLTTDTYSGAAVTRAFDAENRMTSETQAGSFVAGSYSYNADGQRVRRTVGGQPSAVTTWQVYGFGGELLAEYAASGAPTSPQKEYGYRNGQLLITGEPPTGQPPPLNAQNVSWANVSSTVTVTGNSVQKTSGAYAWDAGAVSTQTIASGNGYVDFVPGETGTWRMCGLGNGDSSASYSDIEYAFFIYSGGGLSIYEAGIDRGSFGTYAASDHLKVAVENGVVKYYRNDTLLYTSTVAPQYPLLVDTSMNTVNAGVYNVVLANNAQNVSWTNVSSTVQVTGNSIQKTSGTNAWDAGAVSTQTIASGSGYVDFVPGETGTWRMCGLGNGDSSASYTDIEYAFFIYQGGLSIYEAGIDRGSFGTYAASDHLKVAVENGVVKYYRNATLLYTSTVAPTYPLLVDTSLNTVNAGVYNVMITSTTPSSSGNIQWLVSDQLGTPRMVFDKTGALATTKRHDYLPFGEELFAAQGARTTAQGYSAADGVRQKFTRYERDNETGLDYARSRYYGSSQGRFTSSDILFADQKEENPQSWNLYTYCRNDPVNYVDPEGKSTHTDKNGNVVAVYNDNDFGVYKHDNLKKWDGKKTLKTTGKGVWFEGQTEYWDEFRAHDNKTGATLSDVAKGARIIFGGASFDQDVQTLNSEARNEDLRQVGNDSRPNQKFDIKNNSAIAPYGPNTGKLLNGYFVTARSAGNYLAGYNGATSTYFHQYISGETFMKMAGALQQGQWSKTTAAKIVTYGKAYGPAPWYGEIEYTGRRVEQGFNYGVTQRPH